MLVRLRRLHRVEEVKLVESKQDEVEAGGAAAPAAPGTPAGGGTAGADDGCGTTRGVPNFVFKLVVTFTPGPVTPATEGRGVPASLGGGS